MGLYRGLWVAAVLAALLVPRIHGDAAEEGGSRGLEVSRAEPSTGPIQQVRGLQQFGRGGFSQQGNFAQGGFALAPEPFRSGGFPAQGGTFNGQTRTFPGQTGGFAGQARTFPGQARTFNGQAGAFSGQTGTFNGQAGAFSGQTGTFNGQTGAFNAPGGTFNGQAGAFPAQAGAFPVTAQVEPPSLLDVVQKRFQEIRNRPRAPFGDRLANLAAGVGSVVRVVADVADIVDNFAEK